MYNEGYWKEKKRRIAITALTVRRPSRFLEFMKAIFTPSENISPYRNHTRPYKERLVRRQKHKDRMREL